MCTTDCEVFNYLSALDKQYKYLNKSLDINFFSKRDIEETHTASEVQIKNKTKMVLYGQI